MAVERTDRPEGHSPNKVIIPGRCVRLSGEAARVSVPGTPGAEPRVELIRAGDVVQAIDVTCTCGQRIRIRCDYGKPA